MHRVGLMGSEQEAPRRQRGLLSRDEQESDGKDEEWIVVLVVAVTQLQLQLQLLMILLQCG